MSLEKAMVDIRSEEEFRKHVDKHLLSVIHFWAPWAKQCETMDEAVGVMAEEMPKVGFARVEAEEVPDLAMTCSVSAVPTFVFYSRGQMLDERLEGAKAVDLTKMVRELEKSTRDQMMRPAAPAPPMAKRVDKEPVEKLDDRLKKLINRCKCMLFMKGDPANPKCGFSRTTVALLDSLETEYGSFDILGDEEVRQGLKTFSNWPTYPQLYVDGELVGGLDILKEMNEAGELEPILPKKKPKEDLDAKLKRLIQKHHLMIFMKGSPESPKCGFSNQLMGILKELEVEFDTFDILGDEEVRQGLKKYSDWPTYPQVYVKGELIGGLDIIKELKDSGELISTLKG